MPLNKILQSLKNQHCYCNQPAGILQRTHPQCRQTHQAGWKEMTQLAAQAAGAHTFNESALRQTLQAIAQRSRATGEDIDRALEEGFRQGVAQAMSDGILTRPIEWEETVHADTGLMGLTTKHIYFAPGYGACRHHPPMRRPVACLSGARKKFRVRYDRIVSFDPQGDGFVIMRDAQTAKPQTFRTGDGWFAYNLAVNLSQN